MSRRQGLAILDRLWIIATVVCPLALLSISSCEVCPNHDLSPRYAFTELQTFGDLAPYAVDDGEIEASDAELVITYRGPDGSLWRVTYQAVAR